ncbi:MAG: 1-phosphofructokinase family hexose kinase [Armatimonadetes bacterium]|nr:1-phosphofructokinase family hexose kinase [Armatimonadota bacterium]
MILTVTLNPSVDQTLFVDQLLVADTNRVKRTETDAGGKGLNLSRVVATLGGSTTAISFLGGDTGEFVRMVLERGGVTDACIPIQGVTRTNISVETLEDNQPPTTLNSKGPEIQPEEWGALLAKVEELAPSASWVMAAGSIPPGIQPNAYQELGRLIRKSGAKFALDADGDAFRFGLESGPSFIKPNTKEAGRFLGRQIESLEDCLKAAAEIREQLAERAPDPVVVISRAAEGAVMACGDGLFVGESPRVKAQSTIGSGDSLIGAMLYWVEQGSSWADALKWGLAAGAATAETDGSKIGDKAMILELLGRAIVRPA